ncbi:MAG: hypothetical protein NT062_26675 [Proteobacteria bacterium]|nr:hypothetical protein [Pseudomonadota bacterium]
MTVDQVVAEFGVYGGTLLAAIVSGFVPLIAIDVLLVAIAVASSSPSVGAPTSPWAANLPVIVGLAALGTLLGKLPTYYAVRGLAAIPGKHQDRVERTRAWLARWKSSPRGLLVASSFLGLPPFSIVATVAGAFGIRTRPFCAIVLGGRLARFAIVVIVAAAL